MLFAVGCLCAIVTAVVLTGVETLLDWIESATADATALDLIGLGAGVIAFLGLPRAIYWLVWTRPRLAMLTARRAEAEHELKRLRAEETQVRAAREAVATELMNESPEFLLASIQAMEGASRTETNRLVAAWRRQLAQLQEHLPGAIAATAHGATAGDDIETVKTAAKALASGA